MVRPRQLDLQETYPRRAARTVRGRAHASQTTAGVDSRRLVYDEWHNFLGNKPMVEALLSCVRHYCHTVTSTVRLCANRKAEEETVDQSRAGQEEYPDRRVRTGP